MFAVPPIPKATGPVELLLPPTEDRPHRYFVLPNGLEVIVVSDPKADKAALRSNASGSRVIAGSKLFDVELVTAAARQLLRDRERRGT